MSAESPEQRLDALGLRLPEIARPIFNYVPSRLTGNLLFLSGHGPLREDGTYSTGLVGTAVSVEQAYQDARLTGLLLLASAKAALGELGRIRAAVKVFGMVQAELDFVDHPRVINGCSDLFVEVLGEAGRHARSAVGMGSLPNRMTVEIEAIFEVL